MVKYRSPFIEHDVLDEVLSRSEDYVNSQARGVYRSPPRFPTVSRGDRYYQREETEPTRNIIEENRRFREPPPRRDDRGRGIDFSSRKPSIESDIVDRPTLIASRNCGACKMQKAILEGKFPTRKSLKDSSRQWLPVDQAEQKMKMMFVKLANEIKGMKEGKKRNKKIKTLSELKSEIEHLGDYRKISGDEIDIRYMEDDEKNEKLANKFNVSAFPTFIKPYCKPSPKDSCIESGVKFPGAIAEFLNKAKQT